VKVVGITSLLWDLHRFPFAASAEYLPSGRYNSNVLTGTSGTVLNVVLVIPALLINVVPVKSTRTPSPCSTTISEGKASPPWETKYTGPVSSTGNSGVEVRAIPTTDAGGQVAGFVSNCAAGQAFCSVVSREGSCRGSETFANVMFAAVPTEPAG
jgi:hypothetical protein